MSGKPILPVIKRIIVDNISEGHIILRIHHITFRLMQIKVNVKDKVFCPASEVFEAIVDPDKISGYFASDVSSRLSSDTDVRWNFEDVGAQLDIHVVHVEKNRLITFEWRATGKSTLVDILLTPVNATQTNIEITEAPFDIDNDELERTMQQTQGWTDFICSLKAYLYTGVNLRNGEITSRRSVL